MSWVDIGAWFGSLLEGTSAADAAVAADGSLVAGTAAEGSAGAAAASSSGGYLAAASAATSAASAIAGADAQRRSAHTNADIARQNATIAAQQANVNEDAQRRRGAIAIGRGAAAAAEGTGLAGTNLDMIQQSAVDAETDALNIRYAGKLGVMSDTGSANFDDMSASSATSQGYLNAGAAALSSAGSYVNANRKIVKAGG